MKTEKNERKTKNTEKEVEEEKKNFIKYFIIT